jgi:hypothetical protein
VSPIDVTLTMDMPVGVVTRDLTDSFAELVLRVICPTPTGGQRSWLHDLIGACICRDRPPCHGSSPVNVLSAPMICDHHFRFEVWSRS